jgi:hypothetical protein
MSRWWGVLAVSGLLVGLLGLPVRAGAEALEIEKMIATAKSAADHEAIAAHYEREASDARAKAEQHKTMEGEYRNAGGPAAKERLPDHCARLVKEYQAQAKTYAAMAQAHRDLARTAK